MSKKAVIKKSISLREDVYNEAEKMSEKLFGGNFSAYLTYLICSNKHGFIMNAQVMTEDNKDKEEVVEKKEEEEEINNFTKSEEHEDYINELLNL